MTSSETRTILVEQLREVFIAHGFHGATLTELARAAGLSKASLYHHFPGGKGEMAATLVRHAIAEAHTRAYRHLKDDLPAAKRLARFLQGFTDYVDDGRRHCLLAVLGQQALPAAQANLAELIATQFRDWEADLADVYAALGNKPKRAARLAAALLAELYGALVLAKLHNDPRRFRRQLKRTARQYA